MPERVTKEERKISMAIEKARNAKEVLYQSLMDNNRSELKDESEAVKVTRPKAENVNLEMKPQGKHSGFGLDSHATAGESLKKQDELDTRRREQDKMILSGFKKRAKDMIARAKQVRNEAADLYNQDGEFGFDYNMKKLNDAIQEYIKDIEEVEKR